MSDALMALIVIAVLSTIAIIVIIIFYNRNIVLTQNYQENTGVNRIQMNATTHFQQNTTKPNKSMNDIPEPNVLDLTPFAMEEELKKSCVCLSVTDTLEKLENIEITNEVFLRDERLTRMVYYAPYIIHNALCLKDSYTFGKYITTGNGGAVMTIISNYDRKEYVVKLMEYDISFVYEVQSARKFMKLGIGVDIYQACRVQVDFNKPMKYLDPETSIWKEWKSSLFQIGIIVMEKVHTTLLELCNNDRSDDIELLHKICPQIKEAFTIMENNHCSHYDMHRGNIGFNDKFELKLLNYGMSSVLVYYSDLIALSFAKSILSDEVESDFTQELWKHMKDFIMAIVNNIFPDIQPNYDDIFEVYIPRCSEINDHEIKIRSIEYDKETEAFIHSRMTKH
jgi:hypothetical protein